MSLDKNSEAYLAMHDDACGIKLGLEPVCTCHVQMTEKLIDDNRQLRGALLAELNAIRCGAICVGPGWKICEGCYVRILTALGR